MNPDFSRRAGRAKAAVKAWRSLSIAERREYVRAVEKAGEFEKLPEKWKDFILRAEKEIREERERRQKRLARIVKKGDAGKYTDAGRESFGAVSVLCNTCKHLHRDGKTCDAFPDGIPDRILAGWIAHRAPVRGDHGIQYEPKK